MNYLKNKKTRREK